MPEVAESLYGKRALEHAKAISKPRRTGSPGEKEARSYIQSSLRSMGYKISEEEFNFQASDNGAWRNYFLGLIALCVCVGVTIYLDMKVAAAILAVGVAIYGISSGALHRNLLKSALQGKSHQSSNLFATPPGPPCFGPRLLLVAHYDSKSQSFSIRGRIFWITSTIILGILLPVSTLLWVFLGGVFTQISFAIGGVLCVALFCLALMETHDQSPGALDNAAAVGILLELAERLRLHAPSQGKEVAFFFSGAEEEGVVGAMAFMGEHAGALHERSHQIVNLDIVGADSDLYVWGAGPISQSVEEHLTHAAAQEKISLKKLSLVLGAAADHLPFASANVPAVTLTSPFGVLGKIHTSEDKPELLSEKKMGEIVRLLENLARSGYGVGPC